jgi:hypothetical protein
MQESRNTIHLRCFFHLLTAQDAALWSQFTTEEKRNEVLRLTNALESTRWKSIAECFLCISIGRQEKTIKRELWLAELRQTHVMLRDAGYYYSLWPMILKAMNEWETNQNKVTEDSVFVLLGCFYTHLSACFAFNIPIDLQDTCYLSYFTKLLSGLDIHKLNPRIQKSVRISRHFQEMVSSLELMRDISIGNAYYLKIIPCSVWWSFQHKGCKEVSEQPLSTLTAASP